MKQLRRAGRIPMFCFPGSFNVIVAPKGMDRVPFSPENILLITSNTLFIDPKLLKSPSRKREVCEARFIAMYCSRLISKASTKKIGKVFNRDHSSVVNATKVFLDLYQTNACFKQKYILVDEAIKSQPKKEVYDAI